MLSDFSLSDNTVGFLIEGNFDKEMASKLISNIEAKLDFYDTINLYLEDVNIEEFSISAVLEEMLFKVNHSDRFNKIALVTDRKWFKACAAITKMFMSSQTRTYSPEDRVDAITWVSSPD